MMSSLLNSMRDDEDVDFSSSDDNEDTDDDE